MISRGPFELRASMVACPAKGLKVPATSASACPHALAAAAISSGETYAPSSKASGLGEYSDDDGNAPRQTAYGLGASSGHALPPADQRAARPMHALERSPELLNVLQIDATHIFKAQQAYEFSRFTDRAQTLDFRTIFFTEALELQTRLVAL